MRAFANFSLGGFRHRFFDRLHRASFTSLAAASVVSSIVLLFSFRRFFFFRDFSPLGGPLRGGLRHGFDLFRRLDLRFPVFLFLCFRFRLYRCFRLFRRFRLLRRLCFFRFGHSLRHGFFRFLYPCPDDRVPAADPEESFPSFRLNHVLQSVAGDRKFDAGFGDGFINGSGSKFLKFHCLLRFPAANYFRFLSSKSRTMFARAAMLPFLYCFVSGVLPDALLSQRSCFSPDFFEDGLS